MALLKTIATILYWAIVGYIPISIFRFGRKYAASIGCPESGDCYAPGSEHILSVDLLVAFSAVVLWPLIAWKVWSLVWDLFENNGKKKPNI